MASVLFSKCKFRIPKSSSLYRGTNQNILKTPIRNQSSVFGRFRHTHHKTQHSTLIIFILLNGKFQEVTSNSLENEMSYFRTKQCQNKTMAPDSS